MLTILGRANSANVQKVMWAVHELGLEYDRKDLGGPHGGLDAEGYRALNPNGVIPTIIDGDTVVWESNAIIRYLAQKHDDGGLWPSDPGERACADMWMDWMQTTLTGPLVKVWFGFYRTPEKYHDKEQIALDIAELGRVYGLVDKALEGKAYIAGDQLTMGDIPIGLTFYRYFTIDIDRPAMPNLEATYRRLTERPAYRDVVMTDYTSLKDTLIPGQAH